MNFELAKVARVLESTVSASGEVSGYSVDSRDIQAGDLFFALRGPNHDGHRFVMQALEKGAVACVVSEDADGAAIKVNDTLLALRQLASWARTEWGGEVIGVTGSAGKTTTKDLIAAVLGTKFVVGKTVGNLNNHVGLPLSILRMSREAELAVLELGMNHAGEIRDLAALAKPRIGVVTNAGYAHIENFDSVEGIAAAKRELIDALPADGIAILNADDERVRAFPAPQVVTFGLSEHADVRAEDVEYTASGVKFRVGGDWFESALTGKHGVSNILAAIAVAQVHGIAAGGLQDAVRAIGPGKMRGEQIERNGILIYNDCYNSNPDAARGMIDVLRDAPARRRIAVLGEMLELGRFAEPLHRDVGCYAVAQGVSVLVGIRGAARHMVDAAMRAGLPHNAAYFFEDPESAGDYLREVVREGDAMLFKGSRGTHVEKALERFLG